MSLKHGTVLVQVRGAQVMSETLHPKAHTPNLYRVTSLIRNSDPLGPYSRTMPRALRWSWGRGLFLMSEVPLQVYEAQVVIPLLGAEAIDELDDPDRMVQTLHPQPSRIVWNILQASSRV